MKYRHIAVAGVLGLAGLFASGCGSAQEATSRPTAQLTQEEPRATPKAETRLTLEQIAVEMRKPSVEKILEGSGVRYINDTNFDRFVTNGDRPSVVMFYGGLGLTGDSEYCKREAIILRVLQERFNGRINFYAFEVSKRNFDRLLRPLEDGESSNEFYGLNTTPSLALYNDIDFVTDGYVPPENNRDGNPNKPTEPIVPIKMPGKRTYPKPNGENGNSEDGENGNSEDGEYGQIDILRGGPKSDEWLLRKFLSATLEYWLPTNITNPNEDEKGQYICRWNNSENLKKVYLLDGTENLNNQ